MSYVIKSGKTVEEAVANALDELHLSKDQVKIEVIEEGTKGFLGIIGAKEATVKVTEIQDTKDILKEIFEDDLYEIQTESNKPSKEKVENEPEKANLKEKAEDTEEFTSEPANMTQDDLVKEYMEKIMVPLQLDYKLEVEQSKDVLNVNIIGDSEKLGIVIGKRGVTLDAIQYLLSLIINKNTEKYIRVNLDSSGYRAKREETLRNLAHKMANKALKSSRSIKLEPMNAAERRIIHASLQNFDGVSTHSEGREPFRKVVIQKERKY